MRLLIAFVVLLISSGCATVGKTEPNDPWEGMNRSIYNFNESADIAILQPIAKGYNKLPSPCARAWATSFANLDDVATALNNFLQGKPTNGVSDVGRVVVNSVVRHLRPLGRGDAARPREAQRGFSGRRSPCRGG
jgi:phospholipid-binding lipoprotein MlaA